MIYLIQDCYKNDKGEYIDILKIGYSDKPFMKSRNNQYRTHNFGYRFLGEREGDTRFESYFHEKYKSLRLSEDTEWFLYDDSIVNEFFTVDESVKDIILTKCQYISNIQEYLLRTITKPGALYNKYKDLIIEGLESEYSNSVVKEEVDIIRERIKDTFILGYNITINYIRENCTLSNECFNDIPDLISKTWLNINPWKNRAELFFKLDVYEKTQESFDKYLKDKEEQTNSLLNVFKTANKASKHNLAIIYQRDAKTTKYKFSYVAVNKHGGSDLLPDFNSLVMVSEIRAFEIQQKDYKDRFAVFSSIVKDVTDNIDDINDHLSQLYEIKTLAGRYKYFCSLPDDIIHSLLPHLPESYTNYYTVLGVDKMRALGYNATDMKKEYEGRVGNQSIDIKTPIISEFQIGSVYTKSYIKNKLGDIYNSLGYFKTPKALDIEDYFIIKNKMIPNEETGKRDAGYLIVGIKK